MRSYPKFSEFVLPPPPTTRIPYMSCHPHRHASAPCDSHFRTPPPPLSHPSLIPPPFSPHRVPRPSTEYNFVRTVISQHRRCLFSRTEISHTGNREFVDFSFGSLWEKSLIPSFFRDPRPLIHSSFRVREPLIPSFFRNVLVLIRHLCYTYAKRTIIYALSQTKDRRMV